ncbi:biopolymer transporter ExbD [candidate division KSB1 bacterium]|nr:biopolymer transporter ExbD [candidate division KSB1 bacterium]
MGGSTRKEADLDMTAVMNIFLILIPFLLLTAVFVRISILDISLPTGGGGGGAAPPPGRAILVIIAVTADNRMQIKTTTTEIQFETIYSLNGNEYNYAQLVEQLNRLKTTFPWLEELVLQPEENVKYEVIIKIMDRCREHGFPNISLA